MSDKDQPVDPEGPFHISVAGAGGQGIVSMSYLLAHIGMRRGYQVSWFPSYGAAMRGGTATCSVVISRDEIPSPIFSKSTHGMFFNNPSLLKFEPKLAPNGMMILDSDLVTEPPKRSDIGVYKIPADSLAEQAGNIRAANMVVLGSFLRLTGLGTVRDIEANIRDVLPERHWKWIPANLEAARLGEIEME